MQVELDRYDMPRDKGLLKCSGSRSRATIIPSETLDNTLFPKLKTMSENEYGANCWDAWHEVLP